MPDTTPERKFYRTRITFEVLSEDPIHPYMDIAEIVAECDDGGYVMDSNHEPVTVELSGAEMAQALHNAGSTPEFFQLDDAGNPIEEDDDGPS